MDWGWCRSLGRADWLALILQEQNTLASDGHLHDNLASGRSARQCSRDLAQQRLGG